MHVLSMLADGQSFQFRAQDKRRRSVRCFDMEHPEGRLSGFNALMADRIKHAGPPDRQGRPFSQQKGDRREETAWLSSQTTSHAVIGRFHAEYKVRTLKLKNVAANDASQKKQLDVAIPDT